MSKKISLLFFFLIGSIVVSAQQTIVTKDGKQYKATPVWDFVCDNYALTSTVQVQLARTEKGGLLKIGVQTTPGSFYISGTVYIYLQDNTFITCTDKGLAANQDNRAYGYYTFTPAEMNKLKNSPIKDIRFGIKGTQTTFSSQTGHFTAVNRASYFEPYDKTNKNIFETDNEVSALYK